MNIIVALADSLVDPGYLDVGGFHNPGLIGHDVFLALMVFRTLARLFPSVQRNILVAFGSDVAVTRIPRTGCSASDLSR